MPLAPGTRLGPYEIVAPIGAGGMGEVYKARDTRLDRTVALKVIQSSVADSPEMRERFEREARAISALDHPNVCMLYDVSREGGLSFLVMQYLEGETLADRLARAGKPASDPSQPRVGSGETTLVPLRFAVDTRTNSIIATGSPGDLAVVYRILVRLDEGGIRRRELKVFRLKNTSAEAVAGALSGWTAR